MTATTRITWLGGLQVPAPPRRRSPDPLLVNLKVDLRPFRDAVANLATGLTTAFGSLQRAFATIYGTDTEHLAAHVNAVRVLDRAVAATRLEMQSALDDGHWEAGEVFDERLQALADRYGIERDSW